MWRSRLPILVSKKEERERRPRITQQEIAEATGLRQATISSWMNWGKFKRLDADVVGALARYLECDPTDLYEFVGDLDEPGQQAAVAAN